MKSSSFVCLSVAAICVYFTIFTLVSAKEKIKSEEEIGNKGSGTKWNELVFTQLWGHSACLQFKQQTKGKQKCRYEDKPSIWSIHGIWPTETGTSGPNFCSKVKFNESLVDPILDELNEFWYEISATKNPKGFWEHEWVKHGSCAMEASEFDSELKYFQQGLTLRNKYDLYSLLKDKGIVPQVTEGYTIDKITSAITSTLSGTPHLQCIQVKDAGKVQYYLLTVEICLKPNLEVRDCSGHSQVSSYLEGSLVCPKDTPIIYTDNFAKIKTEL